MRVMTIPPLTLCSPRYQGPPRNLVVVASLTAASRVPRLPPDEGFSTPPLDAEGQGPLAYRHLGPTLAAGCTPSDVWPPADQHRGQGLPRQSPRCRNADFMDLERARPCRRMSAPPWVESRVRLVGSGASLLGDPEVDRLCLRVTAVPRSPPADLATQQPPP